MNKLKHSLLKILKICRSNSISSTSFTFIFLFCALTGHSQLTFLGASASYSDSYRSWEIYSVDSTDIGSTELLDLKWPLRNDWTEWKWETEEEVIYLQQTYRNNDSQWSHRVYLNPITMKAKWRNDPRIWTISYGNEKFIWKTANNLTDQWVYNDKEYGYFEVITTYENDPRDWEILDESSLPDEVKRSMIFISLYVASPKL